MTLKKVGHYVLLIVVIVYFSWLNSKPRDNKEGFHPRIKEQYRSGMRNINMAREGFEETKRQTFRLLSKKLGY